MEAGYYNEQSLPDQETVVGNIKVTSKAVGPWGASATSGAQTVFTATSSCYLSGGWACWIPVGGKPGYYNQAEPGGGAIIVYSKNGSVKQTIANGTYGHYAGISVPFGPVEMSAGDYIVMSAWGTYGETDKNYTSYSQIQLSGTLTTISLQ